MKKLLTVMCASLFVLSLIGCSSTGTPTPGTADPSTDSSLPETPVEGAIDYNTVDASEWVYGVDGADEEVTKLLMTIDMTEHGSAGSSLKEAIAAVNVLKLIGNEQLGEKAAAYLDGMNALQRDYFSFQWQMATKTAADILADFDSYKELLSDAGFPEFSIKDMTAEGLELVKSQMNTLLADRNVTDVWKGFSSLEPFANAG